MHSWELLRKLAGSLSYPWVCMGDFNEILSLHEKTGTTSRSLAQMNAFQQTLDDCGLFDINFMGFPFTWKRGKEGNTVLWERLDRGIMNVGFWQLWHKVLIHHIDNTVSDHTALLLECDLPSATIRHGGARRFLFETMWMKEENFEEVVKEAWSSGDSVNIDTRIQRCASTLTHWNHHSFKRVTKEIQGLKKEMAELNLINPSMEQENRLRTVSRELEKLLEQEELMWRQRSRVSWLKEGDKNTRFFHERAKARGKKNQINGIFNMAGEWQTEHEQIASVFEQYFAQLFTKKGGIDMQHVLEGLIPKVSQGLILG